MAPPPSASGAPPPPAWVNIVPMVLMVVIFYFVLIRPQQKKAKEHDEMIKTLKSGDRVITSAGIMGVVMSVKDKSVFVRSGDSKFEVTKSSVTNIVERGVGSGD